MPTPSVNMNLKRAGSSVTAILSDLNTMPSSFPLTEWNDQSARYIRYWRWFDGTNIEETLDTSKGGDPVYKFPLRINPVRNFSRKRGAVLLGEEAFDSPEPLVKALVTPKKYVDGEDTPEADQKGAELCQSVINQIWQSSNGRAIQMENAVVQQFLGGCVFGIRYQPWREDLDIPLVIENIMPDFFMPVWSSNDYYNLLEAWVVYKIPPRVAQLEYGWEGDSAVGANYVLYVEHWTREEHSIFLNGEPLVFNGMSYDHAENPWGFVPFVYIPSGREGDFYGPSIIEDIEGLVLEYNARLADQGDAIRKTVHRVRYAINIQRTPTQRQLSRDVWAIDLGQESPVHKNPPTVKVEDPPDLSTGLMNFSDDLWVQLMREAMLGPIAFGEDEGSQRSALTLAFRMWPTTSNARVQRTFWTDGLNRMAYMLLKMITIIQKIEPKIIVLPFRIPDDFSSKFRFASDWLPQIPRDREQMVSEIILRYQSGLLSIDRALQSFGDIRDIKKEKELILEWKKAVAKIEVTQQGQGVQQDLANTPQATVTAGDE